MPRRRNIPRSASASTRTCRKGSGSCTYKSKDGYTVTDTFEVGSDLKEYTYKITGGTGKYKGSTRGGPYLYENLTDTLAGGRFNGKIELP